MQVAKLAGIPEVVIQAAKAKLASLENGDKPALTAEPAPITSTRTFDSASKPGTAVESPLQSDLFSAASHPAIDELGTIEPDDLSPKQALELVYKLKKMLN